jgi:hypothetical protein
MHADFPAACGYPSEIDDDKITLKVDSPKEAILPEDSARVLEAEVAKPKGDTKDKPAAIDTKPTENKEGSPEYRDLERVEMMKYHRSLISSTPNLFDDEAFNAKVARGRSFSFGVHAYSETSAQVYWPYVSYSIAFSRTLSIGLQADYWKITNTKLDSTFYGGMLTVLYHPIRPYQGVYALLGAGVAKANYTVSSPPAETAAITSSELATMVMGVAGWSWLMKERFHLDLEAGAEYIRIGSIDNLTSAESSGSVGTFHPIVKLGFGFVF